MTSPPATTYSRTGTPATPNVSTIVRAPNAVASSSARYTCSARGAQRLSENQPGQRRIDEHGAVAVHPVERHQPVRPGRLGERELGQVLVDRPSGGERRLVVTARDLVVDVPGEDVADTRLAGFVPVGAGDDAAVDDAAHAGDLDELVVVHHVTRRGAHDRQHLPGLRPLAPPAQ